MRFCTCVLNFRLRLLLAWGIALGGASSTLTGEELHPQDGPHVDIRIFIDAEAVVLQLEMNLVFLDYLVIFRGRSRLESPVLNGRHFNPR